MRSIGNPVDIGGITITPGDIIHAGSEGVIRIPNEAIPAILERAPSYRAFEHEAHRLLRRTDIKATKKRELLDGISQKYGLQAYTASEPQGDES